MKVLGLSASPREWGNTDILVRHSLAAAGREGAETRFLRLSPLALAPCTGCMACVFKDRDCRIDEGLPAALEQLRWADAVVLGSPTYILGTTAVIKTLQERLVRFATVSRELAGKPAVAIAAAGVPTHADLVMTQLCLTLLAVGMPLVDRFIGYGQGPGEVVYDEIALARAAEAGAALGRGETAFRGEEGACPCCHLDAVVVTGDGRGRCVLCDLPGAWVWDGGAGRLRPDAGALSRWTEERVRQHVTGSMLPSGPRFLARRGDIRTRLEALRQAWGDPPGADHT